MGGIKRTPRDCPTSPRWPTGAVCTRGSALHNVSRAHSRWVLRSRWKGSRGLPVQSEVPSGLRRRLKHISPALSRAGASCSRESGPKIRSRFTDSRWTALFGGLEQEFFVTFKHMRPSKRPQCPFNVCPMSVTPVEPPGLVTTTSGSLMLLKWF